ncbi:MAG: hypothetical protein ACYCVH_02345 [Ignavibacteriaceae bacterium]
METKKILPSFVCGFGAAVLTTVPGVKNVGCCLVVPLAAFTALFLDHKINKSLPPINIKKAIAFGILTGIFAAFFSTFFDVLITFISRTNDYVEALPQTESLIKSYKFVGPLFDQTISMLHSMANQIKLTGFSPLYTFMIFITNIFIDLIFGVIGGLLGMSFFNKRNQP